MKKLFGVLMICSSLFFAACSEDKTNPDDGKVPTEEALEAVINTYVDRTVIPTYADMKAKVSALKTKVDQFVEDGSQASLNEACAAWRAAREPWELSEAFLFGPADFLGLDPMLDSWPLDKDAIDQILADLNFEEVEGDENIRGFHTLEYLLFSEGGNKSSAGVTAAEKSYMRKVAELLSEDTDALHGAWADYFGNEFKSHQSQRVGSAQNAVEEIVDGCMSIANEVGSAKIGEPYQLYADGDHEQGVLAVESWYSWNSLDDYRNNIISIENSYMGGRRGSRNTAGSLSALVKTFDENLDTEIQAAIAAAIAAIDGIPAPFRSNLDKRIEIENAQDILDDLEKTLLKIKRALGLN
ncbi:MAG: peptidase M75 [Mediterranea sp.]|nr:peptidase M75 [Mediterranea sp.]